MAKHLKIDKEKIQHNVDKAFKNAYLDEEEHTFLTSLLASLEDLQKDASRYRMWKKLLDDPHLIKEVESILDKYIKQV